MPIDEVLSGSPKSDNGVANGNGTANGNGDGAMKKPSPPSEGKKRSKKIARQNSREGQQNHHVNGSLNGFIAPQRRWKNSRRSRHGHGRGLPKKNGGGGKGVWGLPGSEILEEPLEMDRNDPNYDPTEVMDGVELKEVVAETTPEEFFKMIEPIILEYFEHGDTSEVAISLDEIIIGSLRPLVTTYSVQIALDHKDCQREMISVLISDLYARVVTSRDIAKGYDLLLANLPDLILDTPEAPTLLGNFIARSVADDCIPPKYVTSPDNVNQLNEYALAALKRADALLSLKQGWAHLDNIWGKAGPLRPVKIITKQMILLLKEYISSRDFDEAARCLRAMVVPHYHHELVYEAILIALESVNQQTEEAMCTLLKAMDEACLVLPAQMEQGFQRVYEDMPDIVLDVPLAYIMLDRFIERCGRAKFLSEKIIKGMPSRGRKRFVSEGDGGHIKPETLHYRD